MEVERQIMRGIQERPTTRWRRDEVPFAKTPVNEENFSRDDRPFSRRGMSSRQSSAFDDGATTSSRPLTGSRSAAMYSRPVVAPGTASRLATSMMQQPPSRMGTALNLAGTQVNVMDRPITQQGLSGLRTGTRGHQTRQVQDKRYFEGVLQTKIRELQQEILRLTKEIEMQAREQATFVVYDKRVKEMAAELTELQGKLADYNLVVDKLNTDTEKSEIDAECQEVKLENDEQTSQLEQLFSQRRQREAQVLQLEKEIEQEKNMTDSMLAAMSAPLRERYSELQAVNTQLQQKMEKLQQELDTLTSNKSLLEDQISLSQVKQEAVRLHHKLRETEQRKAALLEEERNRTSPAQAREQLLQRVKDDNAETSRMEHHITEIRETLRKKQEELEQIDQDLDESQSERHQKYKELRKREETMEQFLSTFEENKNEELAHIKKLESQIVEALQQISRNLSRSGHLPSYEDFASMKDNLIFKEGELEKSKKTVDSLAAEHQQLQLNLQKVEALEEKIRLEMETLKTRMEAMESEMSTLSDLDALRDHAQDRRNQLDEERLALLKRKDPTLSKLMDMQKKHDELQKQLSENETYAQLSNLERKLAQLEQNNFAMKEYIASKKSETDYEPLKEKVYSLSQEYNKILKDSLKRGGIP